VDAAPRKQRGEVGVEVAHRLVSQIQVDGVPAESHLAVVSWCRVPRLPLIAQGNTVRGSAGEQL